MKNWRPGNLVSDAPPQKKAVRQLLKHAKHVVDNAQAGTCTQQESHGRLQGPTCTLSELVLSIDEGAQALPRFRAAC